MPAWTCRVALVVRCAAAACAACGNSTSYGELDGAAEDGPSADAQARSDAQDSEAAVCGEPYLWDRVYGGAEDELSRGAAAAVDGGYLIVGTKGSLVTDERDAWALRVDATGGVLWEATYGGAGVDELMAVVAGASSGWLVAGFTESSGAGGRDAWVIALDDAGSLVWEQTYGGMAFDWARALVALPDGFAVAGGTESAGAGGRDIWILRADGDGSRRWERTFGGPEDEDASALLATDEGFLVGATVLSDGPERWQAWLLALDEAGKASWDRSYGGPDGEEVTAMAAVADGLVLAGRRNKPASPVNDDDLWVLAVDDAGEPRWEWEDGATDWWDTALAVAALGGGDVAVGGYRAVASGSYDGWLLRFDAGGTLRWETRFGDPTGDDLVQSLVPTAANSIAMVVTTQVGPVGRANSRIVHATSSGEIPSCP